MSVGESSRRRFRRFREESGKPETKPESPEAARRSHFLRQYRHWLWPYRYRVGWIFLLALAAMAFEMVLPLATRKIIDGILLPPQIDLARKTQLLNLVGVAVLVVLVVHQSLEAYRSWTTAAVNARIVFALRRRLYDRLIRLPLAALHDLKAGGIVSRLSSDVDNVTGLVQMALISPGVALAKVCVTLVILLSINWRLALAAAAMLPPLALVSVLWVRRARPIYRSMADDRSGVDARVAETFGGIRVVRAFRREPRERRDYALEHHTIIRKRMHAEGVEIVVGVGWAFLVPLVSLVVVWFGGWLYLQGRTSIGDLVAFQMYLGLLLYPVWQLILSLSQTQKALASMEKVFEIFERARELPDAKGAMDAPRKVESLRLENVAFEYKPGVRVLEGVDFTVQAGWTVALVGPSGAGKTTITDLVARFFDPVEGRVLLNGVDLRRLKVESYRELLGIVQQDVFLFDGTVRENIAYGREGASEEEVVEAARKANADGFIRELAQGYDTLIGERGVKLSGGQRQRLSIARAILAAPAILILDEATSSLDSESEQLIQSALRELLKERMTFVIAHRLSTITHADLIVALDKGRVREIGTHAALMEKRGFYWAMVERQREGFRI